MSDELLPCPFCGETPEIEDRRKAGIIWNDTYALPFRVMCENKKCLMRTVTTECYANRQDAADAWNLRRYPQVETVEAVQVADPGRIGVYCKDCTRSKTKLGPANLYRCNHSGRIVRPDDFCSRGSLDNGRGRYERA